MCLRWQAAVTDPFWRVLMTDGSMCPFLRMFFRSLDIGDVMAFHVAGCCLLKAWKPWSHLALVIGKLATACDFPRLAMGVLTRSDGWRAPAVESSSDEPNGLYSCQEVRKENGVMRCNFEDAGQEQQVIHGAQC